MKTLQNPNRSQIFRLVLVVLAIVAFALTCTSVGKTGPTGFGSQKIEGAAVASSNENGTVIADNEGARLLFVNQSGQLVGMHGLTDMESPITMASLIHQSGTDVYVAGVRYADDGEGITTEAVVRFNLDGELLGTVWKKEYGEDTTQATPTIGDITTDRNGDLILVQFDQHDLHSLNFSGTLSKVAKGSSDEQVIRENIRPKDMLPFEIRSDPESDRCVMTDYFGNLYVEQGVSEEATPASIGNRTLSIQSFDISNDTIVMYDEKSHSLIRASNLFGSSELQLEEIESLTQCRNVGVCGNKAIAILDGNEVHLYDLQSGSSSSLTEIALRPSFAARTIALLLSGIYLVVLFVVMSIRWIVLSLGQGHHRRVREVVTAASVTLICAAAMIFHLVDVFETSFESRQKNMIQVVSQASVTSPSGLGDAATNVAKCAFRELTGQNGSETEDVNVDDDLMTILVNVEGILTSSFANSNGIHCTLYTAAENGDVRYLFSNSRDAIVLGQTQSKEITSAVNAVIQEANECESKYGGYEKAYYFARQCEVQSIVGRSEDGFYLVSCIAPLVAADGTCCTAIAVTCHAEPLIYGILSNVLGILLVFAMTAVSIFIVSDEALRSGDVYLGYRQIRRDDNERAKALMARPLSFMVNLAFGMDTAFAVVIATEMLANSGMDSNLFLMGIPALAITLGSTIGTMIHGFLSSRVSGRSYALPMLLCGIAAQILCFFAVTYNWFFVFVGSKLVWSICLATISFVTKNRATAMENQNFDIHDDDGKRLPLLVEESSVGLAGKGAAVVAGVLGGALAYAGNQWVYLVGAMLSFAVIPVLLVTLPKGAVISERVDKVSPKRASEFLLSPIMLTTLAFGILPSILASGYKSYILPLFLSSSGVSKTDISCLFAMGNAILYLFSDNLISYRDNRGRWLTTWVGMLCLGVLFVLFSYNQSPTWSEVAVMLITVFAWFADDWKRNAREWARKDFGFSFDQSQALLNTEESLVKNAQSPVLTALLSFGTSTCCFILGIFFAVSGSCYYFLTRKRKDSV